MSTNKPLHPQHLALKSSLLTTIATLQTHITTNRDTHTRNIKALTKIYENLLLQARAANAYAGGQPQLLQLLYPASTSAPLSALAEGILNGPLRKIVTLIRNEEYASRRRGEDTLAIVRALEREVEALEGVGEERKEEEEDGGGEGRYGMGFDGSGNSIGYSDGHRNGYGYQEEDGHVHFHQDIQSLEDYAYIWDGQGYRAIYNFGPAEEEGRGEESKGK